ncbi:T4-like virus tail tube protein gp19-domain-containing protein [Linnemannia elongata]|nr:T4-like virus tail tube protein gp19-domain-containing protein [Linnemannia elongata]
MFSAPRTKFATLALIVFLIIALFQVNAAPALDKKTMAAVYPLATYRFIVDLGRDEMACNAVSGLEQGVETIEYKDGLGGLFAMPGQAQTINVTLKRCIAPKNSQLYDWISSPLQNHVEKKDISISLTDEAGKELFVTWTISNAFPTKLSAPTVDATSNEVAFEEMSLVADRLTIKFH